VLQLVLRVRITAGMVFSSTGIGMIIYAVPCKLVACRSLWHHEMATDAVSTKADNAIELQ
jgi:hypothetical protein